MCGVNTVRGAVRIFASAGRGSVANTSIAAPAIVPFSRAAASASRSTISPRAALTITAAGFIRARASAPMSPRVFSVSGACSEMTSADRRSSSRSTRRAPAARAEASVAKGSWAITVMPKAPARRATAPPTRPMPRRPRVVARSSRPMNLDRVHSPARTLRSASTTRRRSASARASVCSAAATMLPSGAFTAYTPRAVAAGTSMLSTPTPARPTTTSRVAASRTARVTFVSLRTTSASTSPRRAARSASFRPVVWRTSQRARSNARPSSARGSATWTMLRRLATGRDRVGRGTRGVAGGGSGRLLGALGVRAKRRADGDPRFDGLVQIAQRELERAEEGHDVLQRHEPEVGDADELSFHLALATGDDRVVVVAQDANEIARIDSCGWAERRDGRRCIAFIGEELQVDGLEAAARRAGELAMAADDRLEPFLRHEAERLLERDEDVDRRRGRRLRFFECGLIRCEVEVRLRKVGLLVRLPRARAHGHHRDTGRSTPGLLRCGDADVDAPFG